MQIEKTFFYLIIIFCLTLGCSSPVKEYQDIETPPNIDPDYINIVIPPNIAPLNFRIMGEGERFQVLISSEKGKTIQLTTKNKNVEIPMGQWNELLNQNKGKKLELTIFAYKGGKWYKYPEIKNQIALHPTDNFLVYRILYPGYELWDEMGIYQRNLQTFEQTPIIENKSIGKDCVNCHSFANYSPNSMMFHVRGKHGGTVLFSDDKVQKISIKEKEKKGGAVYPAWHPNGKLLAFSTNQIQQFFHASGDKYIEVSDSESDLFLYDIHSKNTVRDSSIATQAYLETFPAWSPDGKYLYYTRANAPEREAEIKAIRYNLVRVPFYIESMQFGTPEVVFAADSLGKSVSFPRVSPDGTSLVFTLANYGNFSIWHNEADLYLLNLLTGSVEELPINSEWVESYHSWSSNGRWLVFSSKRRDTHSARPYLSYFDENGQAHKPFIMPQKDPQFYDRFLKTYNIPEFIKEPIPIKQKQLVDEILQSSADEKETPSKNKDPYEKGE